MCEGRGSAKFPEGPENAIVFFSRSKEFNFLSSPRRYEYHWADGTNIKKPIKCSAPKYIDYLMTWVQDQLDDETLFPSKIGKRGRATQRASRTGPRRCRKVSLWYS